jgi:cyclopropane fatty-acyl-phospholipid synthase-like methyltransferase
MKAGMHRVDRCPNCDSTDLRPFSLSLDSPLHVSQARCRGCDLVFSDPRCGADMLRRYYAESYYREHWPQALSRESGPVQAAVARQRPEAEQLLRYRRGGRLLEIGSSTGSALAAMRDAGFEPHGIELSHDAVTHSREVYELTHIQECSFEEAVLEPGTFDVVYAWHVIEHVDDVDAFVHRVARLLTPGGLFRVGTENWRSAGALRERYSHLLRGLPPPFVTSTEHTYAFTGETLSDLLRRRGFEILEVESYQPSWDEKLRTMSFRSPLSRGLFWSEHVLNLLAHTGPLLRLMARRR